MEQVASIIARFPLSTTIFSPAFSSYSTAEPSISTKGLATAGQLLHDEALAAEEARAQPLVEVDGQLYSRHGGQKGALLEDHIVAGSDGDLLDLAGEAGAEGDHPAP